MNHPIVVAYGGGVNSTAMLVEMFRRGIRPDLILFADTGGERPETYAALKTVSAWCVARGFPAILTVKATFKGEVETLEANCLRMKMLPSIAYGFKSCSDKKKIRPQDKFVNSWEPALVAFLKHLKSETVNLKRNSHGLIFEDGDLIIMLGCLKDK